MPRPLILLFAVAAAGIAAPSPWAEGATVVGVDDGAFGESSAAQVLVPTMPSATRPWLRWNCRTAASVASS